MKKYIFWNNMAIILGNFFLIYAIFGLIHGIKFLVKSCSYFICYSNYSIHIFFMIFFILLFAKSPIFLINLIIKYRKDNDKLQKNK
jgi:hypothetical protein